MAGGVNQIIYK